MVTSKDFVIEQILQRIETKFNEPLLKDAFEDQKISSVLDKGTLKVFYDIKKNKPLPFSFDIQKEVLGIIAYVVDVYKFREFVFVEVENLATAERVAVSGKSLAGYLK